MIDKTYVDNWLADFLGALQKHFGKRILYAANHGSWARGEARPESDIDCMVVMDKVNDDDITAFRDIMNTMPGADAFGSGLFLSAGELKQTPRFNTIQFFYGCNVLYGSLEGIIEPPGREEFIMNVMYKANENLHHARHYLLFPHDLPKVVHRLKYPFKNCYYALQSWVFLKEGIFILRKDDMLELLDDENDKQVVLTARDWYRTAEDRTARPAYYIELLERWSKGMIGKVESAE
jgi:predicted nucleotidyltransferase